MSDQSSSSDEAYSALQKEGRERWKHEDHLMDHRLTWLGFTQTILFAGQGIVVQQLAQNDKDKNQIYPSGPHSINSRNFDSYNDLLEQFHRLLPLVGFVSSFLIFSSVVAATIAMVRIKKIHNLPTYGVSWSTSVGGWISAVGLPFLFLCIWSSVMRSCLAIGSCIVILLATLTIWIVEFRRDNNAPPSKLKKLFKRWLKI